MCNYLSGLNQRRIKSKGYGWKLFGVDEEKNTLTPYFEFAARYETNNDGWVRWYEHQGCGFCFFLTKKELLRFMKTMKKGYTIHPHAIRKIAYRQGMGRHNERSMLAGHSFDVALCKEFKILKETLTCQ